MRKKVYRFFLDILVIVFLSLISAFFYARINDFSLFPENTEVYLYSKKYPEIRLLKLKELLKLMKSEDLLLIDARDMDFYIDGHIKGAVNVPYQDFVLNPFNYIEIFERNKNKKIVIYCDGGFCELSFKLAKALIENGIKGISIYIGGYNEWERAGFPVEKAVF
jgi:rhodanese-related sulfurtransferase